MEQAKSEGRFHDQERRDSWLGNGDLHLARTSAWRRSASAPARRRNRACLVRHAGHWNRNLHSFRGNCFRQNRSTGRQNKRRARRQCSSSRTNPGGSSATSTVIPAIVKATENAVQAVLKAAAKTPNSPFEKADPKTLKMTGGRVHDQNKPPESGVPFQEILTAAKLLGLDGHET